MLQAGSTRLAALLLIVAGLASVVMAQVVPSSSIDPLNGSSFTTPYYTVAQTYTITTTFPDAGPTTQTVISGGAGPSPATGAYTFSYNAPLSSLSGVEPTEVFSSLAANGLPTAYTNAYQPETKGLQIVDNAGSSLASTPLMAFGTMTVAVLLGALWIL